MIHRHARPQSRGKTETAEPWEGIRLGATRRLRQPTKTMTLASRTTRGPLKATFCLEPLRLKTRGNLHK